MLGQPMLWRLPSAAVTRDEEQDAQRLGYWLRRVREKRGETLSSAAIGAGLAAGSGSTISLWERGQRPIKRMHLYRLARHYGVPPSFFTHPQKTDDERLDEALADASRLEQQDWEEGLGEAPGDGDGRPGGPNRLH